MRSCMGFRQRRGLRDLGEGRRCLSDVADPGEGVGAQARGALEIVLGIARDDPLQIRGGGREILQRQGAQRTPVERIDRVVFRDHAIETFARPRKLLVVEVRSPSSS